MNEEQYQGLNLPQLLDLMHDIVPPEAVSMQPQTPGWWVMLGWAVVVLALAGARWAQKWRKNRYRREAIAMIDEVDTRTSGAATEIARIVKRTALAAYERNVVAALYGAEWAEFLVSTSNQDRRVADSAELIASAAYRPEVDAGKLVKPAKRWIKVHRA